MTKLFTAEFKLEVAKLVVDHGYTYDKAAVAVNVSHLAYPLSLLSCDFSIRGKLLGIL